MTLYLGSEPVSAYVSGTENGRTAYVHIKYSNDGQHMLNNPTAAQRENAYYIGIRADYSATASTTFNDYGWTRVRHDSQFLHLRFSPIENPTNTDMTVTPDSDTQFIGMYVDAVATDSTQATAYQWTRIAYDQCYLHIKYSTSTTVPTSQYYMSDNPNEGSYYLGICWDRNSTAPTTPNSYNWIRVRDQIEFGYSNDGTTALTNPTAAQKASAYFLGVKVNGGSYSWSRIRQDVNSVYVKYATKENGTTYTEVTGANIESATYVGICSTTATTAPSNLGEYNWTKIIDKTHIQYGRLNNSGEIEFVNTPSTASYLGIRVNSTNTAPASESDYTWVQIRQPLTYIHVVYSSTNNPTTNQIDYEPNNNTRFMAVAVTDSSTTTRDPAVYANKWIRILNDQYTYATENYVQQWHDNQKLDVSSLPTKLSQFTDDLGNTPTHTHNNKQDKLVSGTTIKTINGNSILGSGNIAFPTALSGFTDDLGSSPTHTHSQYLTASGNDLTATPTANKIAKFDSNAKMNSTDMTIAEVNQFVSELVTGNTSGTLENYFKNLFADYIVEQGVSGSWTYRKWNSGIAECWGTAKSGTYTNTNSWGGGKYMNIGAMSFPSGLFVAKPNLTASIEKPSDSGMPFISILNASASSFDGYIYDDNATSTGYAYNIYAHAIGRWKE